MAAAPIPDLKTLGRYNIERVLGKGAMGVVYEGVDPRLGRRVAIKTILKAHLDEDTGKDFAMRFVREAQAVARLNHPNIVQVYDFGEENEIAYLVMEFIKGKELKNFFDANERFDLKEVVRIMGELCEALEFAHVAGIIHRDIKPANVMIDAQGRTKLTDFGVARVSDSDKTSVERTQAGTMVGTPAYMSPEQITGGTVDKRSDVFSAGIILYQFLTGEKPFTGSGAWTIAKKIIQEEPPAPSTLNNAVTPLFDAVVNKALSKDPVTRFQSAKDLGLALQRALEGRGADEDDSERTVVGPMTGAPAARPSPNIAGVSAQGTGTTSRTTSGTQSNQEVELEFWRAIKDGNDPDDFELYVQQFPTGIYAALAKRKIAKLRGEPLDDSSVKAREQEKKDQEEAARREAEAKTKLEADKARLEAEMAKKEEEYRKREAEAHAKAEKARQDAAAELDKREAEFKKRQAEQEAKLGMDAKQRAEAEEKARKEAVEKARQEAAKEAAALAERQKAEFAAEREKTRLEAEKAKKEAALAAEQAKKEAAAERERARLEAEKAKKDATLAAEQAKKEAAAFTEKAKKEADALAKKQMEERAKREAEFKKREAELKAQAAAGGKKSSPVVPAIIGVVVLAVAGTGYWFLRPDDKAQRAQIEAMQRQLEEAKKKQGELEQAKKQEEQARLALEKARAAEAEARKSGDLAKQKELAEAMKRAESEAKKSAEATRLREDDAKKSQAAAEKARADQAKVADGKKSASDKSEAAKLAAERAAAEKAVAEAKAQAERAIADARAASERAAAEKAAAEKAAAEAKAQAAATRVASAPTSGEALFSQAVSLDQEGKGRDAVKMYTQAARAGSGKAAKRLGEIYDKGLIGISRDYAESLKWYNAARVLGEDVPMAKSR
jgi:serine/threonine-protein kinase